MKGGNVKWTVKAKSHPVLWPSPLSRAAAAPTGLTSIASASLVARVGGRSHNRDLIGPSLLSCDFSFTPIIILI